MKTVEIMARTPQSFEDAIEKVGGQRTVKREKKSARPYVSMNDDLGSR